MNWRRIFNRYPELRQVIVNTKTDKAFRGVLWLRRWGYLVLRNAYLREHGNTAAVDGEVVIQADNVDFIQVVSR